MKRQLILVTLQFLVITSGVLLAEERPSKETPVLVQVSADAKVNASGKLFGRAQVETTWVGADATGTSVVGGGVWDFDNRGTSTCPSGNAPSAYIKNGAFAQGWTSEDVYAQKSLYWHAEDFTDQALACSANPIAGSFSAWCGRISAAPGECFTDPPGYGHNWNQWLCRSVTLDPLTPTLKYSFNSATEHSEDYAYVIIDAEFPDSCGWIGELADTIRCYDGLHGTTSENIDLGNLCADPNLCDDLTSCDYSGDSVKVCFVVVSDSRWDDEDGLYDTCDGAITVDDISIDVAHSSGEMIITDFEDGTLQGWRACAGWSAGDYAAIRRRDSFINNDPDVWQDCDMTGCVLTFFNPDMTGEYANGGHYPGAFHKRVWSPPIYTGAYPLRDYMLAYDAYLDLPVEGFIFYRRYVRYVQDPDCPAGAWSSPLSDDFVHYSAAPRCTTIVWDFTGVVPADAESIMVGLSAWNGCAEWSQPCSEGNESPIFDNVAVGFIANIKPAVVVQSPNGGEVWCVGDSEGIGWTATDGNGVDSVSIYYSTDGGGNYTLIASGEENDGTYPWTIPDILTEDALVKIEAYDPSLNVGEDVSDAVFRIAANVPPEVTVLAPNGGETWYAGESENVTWTATDVQGVDSVSIYYSTDGGGEYALIASGEENDGIYPWTLPCTPTESGLVKVEAYDPSLNVSEDVSDGFFTIVDSTPPAVTVLTPNGGENWYGYESKNVTWAATDSHDVSSISIYYSTNGGESYTLVTSGQANDGTYPWTIPNTPTDSALVKVIAYDPSLNVGEDVSDSLFAILWGSDETPPRLTISVHQNPELTSELDIYLVPSEALQDTSVWFGVNGSEMVVVPSDTIMSIYKCSYHLSGPGVMTISAHARDLAGNYADTTRAFGAGFIGRRQGGSSAGPQGRITVSCPEYSVKEDTYVLVLPDEGVNGGGGEPAAADFVLSPPALELDRPARLTVELDADEGWPSLWRYGSSGWEAVESSYSVATSTLSALVGSLGRYRVTWDESGGRTERVGLLLRAAPNPFRTTVDASYHLPVGCTVRLAIYDVSGRKVRTMVNGHYGPGWHSERWDGKDERDKMLPSGVYFMILEAGKEKISEKCVLVR